MTAAYTTGTITLTNGSAAIAGTGTGWATALITGGVVYPRQSVGNPLPIASVNSDTSITAAIPWTGASGTYSYALVRDTDYGQQTVANAQALASYLAQLGNSAIAALASLSASMGANKLPYATGSATMAFTTLSAWARTLLDDADVAAFWSTIGATSPADKAFRRGNILGTVAQSSGYPSGALIERGSNASGEYVRFADGTQICTQTGVSMTFAVAARLSYTWTYPAAFLSASKTVIIPTSPYASGDYVNVSQDNIGGPYSSAGASSGTTGFRNGGTPFVSGAALNNCSLMAIGRWF